MIPEINLTDFLYHLPENKIASHPNAKRDESNLLYYKKDEKIEKYIFSNISNLLPSNTNLILNNSKVFPARLIFKKNTGSYIEIFCLESQSEITKNAEYYQSTWLCMVGNLKKWKGEKLEIETDGLYLSARYISKNESEHTIEFSWKGDENIFEIFEKVAELPLPPYMNRKANDIDKVRYQTIYAQNKGSVAAPTAGLHFTNSVLKSIAEKNISVHYLTLHVGAGTFKPIKTDTITQHLMHTEHFSISKEIILQIKNNPQVVVVGTTSMRVIESLYWIGLKIAIDFNLKNITLNQWEAYQNELPLLSLDESLHTIIRFLESKNEDFLIGTTSILIMPGYNFKICKGLITNFHQPESTLILLVAAFVGNKWKEIYHFALENDFKFLSYGDSSLLIP